MIVKNGGWRWGELARVAGPITAQRVLVLLLVLLSLMLLPPLFSVPAYDRDFHWPTDERPNLASAFKAWDGHHYLAISAEGYGASPASAEFFPLWPMLIRVLAFVLGGHHLIAALLLANLLAITALVMLHRLVAEKRDEATADLSVLLLLAYPGALFLAFPYSESLFLLESVAFFLLLQRGRLRSAALVSVLMPQTRAIGLLVLLPLAYEAWRAWREGRARAAVAIASASAPLLGLALYLVEMWFVTGDPLALFSVQNQFIGSGANVLDLVGFWNALVTVDSTHGFLNSAVDRVCFLAMLALLYRTFKLDRSWFLFVLIAGVAPALARQLWGYTRFLVVAFPVFVAAAELLQADRHRWWRWLLLAFLWAVQLLMLIRHVNNHWVG